VLTREQLAEFERLGLVRLSTVFSESEAARMREHVCAALAERFGMRRDMPETWTLELPRHLQSLARAGVFDALGAAALTEAIDDLLGFGTWQHPVHWGQPLITFPRDGVAWDVPHAQWHIDWPARGSSHPLFALKVFAFLAPVEARGGGTAILASSQNLVARYAAGRSARTSGHARVVRVALMREHPWLRELWAGEASPDRVGRFMGEGATIAGVPVRVMELTGATGDVVLCHPWLFHAPASNHLATPRMMVGHNVNTSSGVALFARPRQG